jgi:DNA-nicking Smr family endonuclease
VARVRNLSPDEAKLWRKVARTTKAYKALPEPVTPAIDAPIRPATPIPAAPELPHLALKRAKAARAATPLAKVKPKTAAMPASKLADAGGHKKVRRGKLEIDAKIDLHGMRQIEAQTALTSIIARTRASGGRCILVVTGKGQPIDPGEDFISPQPGVIRRRLPEWLEAADLRHHVSGFAQAHAKDGGSGAFYVLLKAASKT